MTALELFRFRTVRAVQAKQDGFTALSITSSVQAPVKASVAQLENDPIALLGTFAWLDRLSADLASASDFLSPSALIALLPSDWLEQVASKPWGALKSTLSDALASLALLTRNTSAQAGDYGIPVITASTAQVVEWVARILLVYDCVSILAADQSLSQAQRTFQTPSDIQVALSFRSVALPTEYFESTPPVLARQPGVTDLSIVRDEWNRYVPGELGDVVNVLPGETLASSSRHSEETVHSESTTDVQATIQTTENSQTTTQSLSSTASDDASTNIGVHGQVETTGQYGPTTVKTNVGAQGQFSKSSSQSTAITKSVETVSRAVKTVSETVTQTQSTRTKTKDLSNERHSLQNTTDTVETGMYRWLSEVHRVELVNYPNRLVMEFEIPEPGAWLRYALTNQPQEPWTNPDPGAYAVNKNDPRLDPLDPSNPDTTATALQRSDLTPQVAAGLAARWQIQGISSPPPQTIILGNSYSLNPKGGGDGFNDNSLAVPDGYVAKTWFLDATGVGSDDDSHATGLRVAVGGYGTTFTVGATDTALLFTGSMSGTAVIPENSGNGQLLPPLGDQTPSPADSYPVGDINTGTIPVSVNASFLADGSSVTLNINIRCVQAPAQDDPNGNGQPYVTWQQSTFNTIVAAYQNLLSAHNQERAARLQSQTGQLTVGPPALNLSRSVGELKRLAIQDLLGQPFTGYDLLTIGPTASTDTVPSLLPGEPGLDPAVTQTSSPVVQFFEQAFEWENIVYICYPYFWGGHERWLDNATAASADPVFDQFLNAGSVRLVVPARPGFENLVNFFLHTSCIWGGQNPPGPNDPGYLSVADEIQAIQVGAVDGTTIYPPWEIVLPTTLLWAGTDPSTLPANPSPTIGPPPQPPGNVALTITSSANPSVAGQSVSFTATVTAATTGGATPTGQVDFVVDGTKTSDSPIAVDESGSATCAAMTNLAAGSHTVSVGYLGDGTFGAAIANLPAQAVNQADVDVGVTGNPNPVVHRRTVKFTATVTPSPPASGTPTGQVEFQVDGTATRDSPVSLDNAGSATTAGIRTLTAGAHAITATYSGDENFAPASGTLTETAT